MTTDDGPMQWPPQVPPKHKKYKKERKTSCTGIIFRYFKGLHQQQTSIVTSLKGQSLKMPPLIALKILDTCFNTDALPVYSIFTNLIILRHDI